MKTVFFFLIAAALIASSCIEEPELTNLSIVQEPDVAENVTAVKVAIASVISPKESIVYYEEMIGYISKKLGGPVKIVQRRTYGEINDMLKKGEIDFAFVCSGPYVEGHDEFGLKLLVAPQINGKMTYYSYFIVPNNSNYTNVSDLRGRKFAFTDPISNSGRFYPVYILYLMNETPDSFFGVDKFGKTNYFYTYSHDNSIIAVADRLAEGGSVNSLIYEYMKEKKPEIVSRTRIINVSPPFANPPVVVPGNIDPFLEQRLREIFLEMDMDEDGRQILSKVMIDRFVTVNDSAYDDIREMRKKIK